MNRTIRIIAIIVFGISPFIISQSVSAQSAAYSSACQGISELGAGQGCSSGPSTFDNLIKTAVDILSYIVGIAAVIMIIVSGLRFVMAGGESQAVSGAKNSLIWAIVGIAVVALAQVIVHMTLNTSVNIAKNSPTSSSQQAKQPTKTTNQPTPH